MYKDNVKVSLITNNGWELARKYCRVTVGKEDLGYKVSDKFKRDLCYSEHSPIREIRFEIELKDIPVPISQQFSRHRIATNAGDFLHENINPTDIEHYIKSQRPDRTGRPRGGSTDYIFTVNIQGLIDMSKKRLCLCASKEAYGIWNEVVSQICKIDPIIGGMLVPTCVYRGFCPEIKSCGYSKTDKFTDKLAKYRSNHVL